MSPPDPRPPGAWTAAELADPHGRADKQEKVRGMFAAIAGRYDLNNRLHSMWRDQAWRRAAVRASGVRPHDRVLDVACGTGDLSEAFARAGAAEVIGLDITEEMLVVARRKAEKRGGAVRAKLTYLRGDAQQLPFADASFDVVSIAFGIRNVQDPARAVAEFRRVLKPGGRLVILEFAEPRNAVVRAFNTFYCKRVMPITATVISGDRSGAYRYLPKSVETFMSVEQMVALLRRTGFNSVLARPLTLGICMCYRAE